MPILPGVVLLDYALQMICSHEGMAQESCEISSVKFLSPVGPGDELLIRHSVSVNGSIRFEIVSDARKIASGSIARAGDSS